MDLSEYKRRSADLFDDLQFVLDDFEDDLDYEYGQGKLTITALQSGEKYVINTQQAALQIWLAGQATAWHFSWDADGQRWYDYKNSVPFRPTLSERLSKLIGKEIAF